MKIALEALGFGLLCGGIQLATFAFLNVRAGQKWSEGL